MNDYSKNWDKAHSGQKPDSLHSWMGGGGGTPPPTQYPGPGMDITKVMLNALNGNGSSGSSFNSSAAPPPMTFGEKLKVGGWIGLTVASLAVVGVSIKSLWDRAEQNSFRLRCPSCQQEYNLRVSVLQNEAGGDLWCPRGHCLSLADARTEYQKSLYPRT